MKKLCLCLTILAALLFFAGCGGSKKENKNDEPDTGETVTDEDAVDSDSSDSSDTVITDNDITDSADDSDTEPTPDTEPTEIPPLCNPNPCENIANSDGTCTQPDPYYYECGCNKHYFWNGEKCREWCSLGNCNEAAMQGSTGKCYYDDTQDESPFLCECREHYSWDNTERHCALETRQGKCTGLPENAEWNTVSEITQYWSEQDEDFWPSLQGSYNEEPDEGYCRFKCKKKYYWDGENCIPSPCDENSCKIEHSDGTCIPLNTTTFSCKCDGNSWEETGFVWDPSSSVCKPKIDYTGLIWSDKSAEKMTASEAAEYCENLGGSWSLPTIDELRTLVKNCDALKPEGDCKVSEYCFTSTSSCYDSGICGCGSSSEEGYYSSLRDNERLWSKTATSKTKTHIWSLDFKSASPIAVNSAARVRCVRHRCDTQNWDDNEKKCVLPERRTKSCGTLPDEYAEWNSASEILQTWNSYTWSWEPPITPQYNETASQAECKYKCKQYYVRENSKCRLQECGTNGTPCLDSTNHLIWGPRNYDYSNSQASTICGETEYLGFTDWRLPTIDELRTLLVNADGGTPRSAACQVSEANNCLSWDACWDCVNCTEQRTLLSNGTCSSSSVEFGNFCKLLGSSSYWSSSLEPDTTNAWYVNCTYGEVLRKDANDSSSMYFCCVKSAE